jgi:hypothetical protein
MPHDNTARQVRIALIQGREQGNPSTDLVYTVARIREAAALVLRSSARRSCLIHPTSAERRTRSTLI